MSKEQLNSSTHACPQSHEAVDHVTPSVGLLGFGIDLAAQEHTRLRVEGELAWNEFCDLQR